uniref:Uncharacterized protein n=1 Tax=Panagrolaimus sp. JU765 TaxID=591449 RepID=A0AC34RLC3_9BILA
MQFLQRQVQVSDNTESIRIALYAGLPTIFVACFGLFLLIGQVCCQIPLIPRRCRKSADPRIVQLRKQYADISGFDISKWEGDDDFEFK